MSLMPKHLPKNSLTTAKIYKKVPLRQLRQWCFFASLTIALLSGCQNQSTPTPSATSTPTAKPTAAIAKEPEGILERVKARGKVICGVNGKLPGFSYVDDKGVWSGLDVDYCRAIAAAVLGDAKAVDFRPLLAKDRFTSVQNGEVDILMRNTTRTLTRDVTPNISFAPTTFFDGQGVMIRIGAKPNAPNSSSSSSPSSSPSPSTTSTDSTTTSPTPTSTPTSDKASKFDSKDSKSDKQAKSNEDNTPSLKEVTGKKVCVETGINATNLESSMKEASIDMESMILPDMDSVLNAYAKGDCDAISSEKSQLAAWRSKLPRPADHKILDVSFSKEPLSPVIVGNDKRWRDVVTWVVYATFYAEELGISMDNYNIFKETKNPEVSRFLGTSDSLGIELGLAPDWTTQILKQVGNYSDIYSRNLSPLDIPRGINRTWKQGGLLYSMPFR
ncbi:transporter substrate-binding domain-containing protein [Pseudanabaena yagii]|uniref:Transporter substrate-binding domain-containing protein n=1 Tax=Pseudanabaena yagii GIHE-NHR1 TaxID=2722753 RepID=A0ABX1LP78_9CYAN|nr:transporter substrate-binding domain-containing protein [Pseudanabaena yagii]NMF57932.1 transporter substrate-binding domain-containing protein [Pseudanabaena yagii GIHE-NHR1]